jgi:hypothetical protein
MLLTAAALLLSLGAAVAAPQAAATSTAPSFLIRDDAKREGWRAIHPTLRLPAVLPRPAGSVQHHVFSAA